MSDNDTIVAQATPPGRGGVGILRISGLKAREVAETVLGKLPKPRYADYLPFKDADGSVLDQGIALWFPGPNSFTGEDVLELQGHGGPVILDLLLKRILTIPGLRIARPGEFSERAFLNDKLDLAQAEAIADLIDASSEQAARSALNSLQGAFSARVNHLVEALTHLRIYVEAAIDFPDEEIDFLSDGKIEAQLNNVIADLDAVRAEARQGSLLREGMKVVIAGRPNAGKSSLLNALAGREAAIVTDIAGTTRDVLLRVTCCVSISTLTECRCISSTPPGYVKPAMKWNVLVSSARGKKLNKPTACCLWSMAPRQTPLIQQRSGRSLSPVCQRNCRSPWCAIKPISPEKRWG